MGTSTDRTAGRGGAWTPLKTAATTLIRGIETDRGDRAREGARRVAARHVATLGGAETASSTARAGRAGTARLGGLLAAIGQGDLAAALQGFGLADLVGLGRFEVLDELVTLIAGDGADLDSTAARDAGCEVLDEIFGDASTFEELTAAAALAVTSDSIVELLKTFLVHYVCNRMPVVAEKLGRLADPEAIARADDTVRDVVRSVVDFRLPTNPLTLDWGGSEGREVAEDAVTTSYRLLEILDIP